MLKRKKSMFFYLSVLFFVIYVTTKYYHSNYDLLRRKVCKRESAGLQLKKHITEYANVIKAGVSVPNPETWCYDLATNITAPRPLPEFTGLLAADRPAIFFIESSCRSQQAGAVWLNARQACAVESAARAHPNRDIYVLFVAHAPLRLNGGDENERRLTAILKQKNIHFRYLNLTHFVHDTMYEDWYELGSLHTSSFPVRHTSDIVRTLLLWKYGGTYLDLDVIVLSNLDSIHENYAGIQHESSITNAVLNVDRKWGKKFIEKLAYKMRDEFNPDAYAFNGAELLTRQLTDLCNTTQLRDVPKCVEFHIYPEQVFYPVGWGSWARYFETTGAQELADHVVKNSKLIHVWNKLSGEQKLQKNTNVAYTILARTFCPDTISSSGDEI